MSPLAPMALAPTAPIMADHHERGLVAVEPYAEAIYWTGRRVWTLSDDPEAGSFEDDDFDGWCDRAATVVQFRPRASVAVSGPEAA